MKSITNGGGGGNIEKKNRIPDNYDEICVYYLIIYLELSASLSLDIYVNPIELLLNSTLCRR